MVAALAKAADPVFRAARSGVADQFGALGGPDDEGVERLEGQRRQPMFELQRDHSGPGDAEVETIVGLAPRRIRLIICGPRPKADPPVPGCCDLRRVGLVAADEPAEKFARFRRDADLQQEVPHHRHPIAAQDETLDVLKIQCAGGGSLIGMRTLAKDTAK